MIRLKKLTTAFICVILSLVCAFGVAFSGCAEYKPPQNSGDNTGDLPDDPNNPDDPVNPDNPDDPVNPDEESKDFSVQLLVKNGKEWQNFTYEFYDASDGRGGAHEQGWIKWDTIKIQWTHKYNGSRQYAGLDENGKATCAGLDGDYQVTILNVPTGFTYECNENYASSKTSTTRNIEIILYQIQKTGATKTLYNLSDHSISYKATMLKTTGVYRAVLENNQARVMYAFQTNKQGVYSLTTLVDVTENKINPKLTVYSGNTSGGFVTDALDSKDDGGSENTYTKNIYWEYRISADETKGGNALFFELYSTSVDGNASYPLTVDFLIQRDGDFTRAEYDTTPVPVTEDFSKTPPTPEGTATEAAATDNLTGEKWCKGNSVILNTESGIADFKSENNKYNAKFVREEELNEQIILNTPEGIEQFKQAYRQRLGDKPGVEVEIKVIPDNVPANDGNYYRYSFSFIDYDIKDEHNQIIGRKEEYVFTLTAKYSFEIIMNTEEGISDFLKKVGNEDAKVIRSEIRNHEVILNTEEGIAEFISEVGGRATVIIGTEIPENDGNYYRVSYDETTDTYTMTDRFEVYDGNYHYFKYYASTDTYVINETYYSTDGYYYFYEYDEATATYILTDRLYAILDAAANSLVDLTDPHINYKFLNGKNYAEFIKIYRENCNGDGAYPVNEELAAFLKHYCLSANMFNDGYGMAESSGYNADEDGMWLLICKYYKK